MARAADVRIEGLGRLMRALRELPKEAQAEMRDEAAKIAEAHMAPAWRAAAGEAGPWGERIGSSVRVRRDRIPAVQIGYARRAFSGGASTSMIRYPSHKGPDRGAMFTATSWMSGVKRRYIAQAMGDWGESIDRVVRRWNTGG
jgi:hypothetical protein